MNTIELKALPAVLDPPDASGGALSVKQANDGSLSMLLNFRAGTQQALDVSRAYKISAKDSTIEVTAAGVRVHRVSASGIELTAPEVTVTWSHLPTTSPVTLEFALTDLSNPDGFPKAQTDFCLGSFSWSLLPQPAPGPWATLSATDVTMDQVSEIEKAVERIIWLLAFANGVSFAIPGIIRLETHDPAGKVVNAKLRNSSAPSSTLRAWQLIPLRIPKEIKAYLEWCYPRLIANDDLYLLSRVIHWLILATRESQVLHLRALISAEVLEILRFNFADKVFKAVQSGDQFEWPAGYPRAGQRMSFREILRGLVWAVGSSQWKEEFVTLRNHIVHQGEILGTSFHDQITNTNNAIHFCQSIVLALLEWDRCKSNDCKALYLPFNVRPSTPTLFRR